MTTSENDRDFMAMALAKARLGLGRVEPNPLVGCVLVSRGQVLAEGYHHVFGGDHAEVDALRQLDTAASPPDLTAYVTLEPCSHFGKTPPCTRALIDAQVRRVVVAMRDPFSQVDGAGIKQLREAGIEVAVGILEQEASDLNRAYLKRLRVGRPWVIAKWAMTMDGRIATVANQSQWITGPQSREQVHRLRSRVDAIVVGMGTVRADDPMLTARLPDPETPPRNATRVVFCHHQLPSTAHQVTSQTDQYPTLLVASAEISDDQAEPLIAKGCELIRWNTEDRQQAVVELLERLANRGMTNVMLEGGGELMASFFEAGQVDEAHVYVGAKTFGGQSAPGPIGGGGIQQVAEARDFRLRSVDRFGQDARMIYQRCC